MTIIYTLYQEIQQRSVTDNGELDLPYFSLKVVLKSPKIFCQITILLSRLPSFLISVLTDCLSWKSIPSDPQYALLGSNISVSWDYELKPGENTTGFFQIIWAVKESSGWKNLAVKSWKSGITLLDDVEHISVSETEKATFIISNVKEYHHAMYQCSLMSNINLGPTYFQLIVLSK